MGCGAPTRESHAMIEAEQRHKDLAGFLGLGWTTVSSQCAPLIGIKNV